MESLFPAVLRGFLVAWFIGLTVIFNLIEARRIRRLAEGREGETICQFARSLDYRRLDTKIIRAVYVGLQVFMGPDFPLRASDDFDQTLRIDWEDLDDLAEEIAKRCGRSIGCWESNPFYGKVATVADLIEFLSALPQTKRLA